MLKITTAVHVLFALLLGACAQLPPTPQDIQAKRFEAAPGKAVIYLVRMQPDLSYLTATVLLDEQMIGSTHAGTYFRLEVAPGRHRISGYAQDNASLTLDVQADHIYFVQQIVTGAARESPHSIYQLIPEREGRAAVARSVLIS